MSKRAFFLSPAVVVLVLLFAGQAYAQTVTDSAEEAIELIQGGLQDARQVA